MHLFVSLALLVRHAKGTDSDPQPVVRALATATESVLGCSISEGQTKSPESGRFGPSFSSETLRTLSLLLTSCQSAPSSTTLVVQSYLKAVPGTAVGLPGASRYV